MTEQSQKTGVRAWFGRRTAGRRGTALESEVLGDILRRLDELGALAFSRWQPFASGEWIEPGNREIAVWEDALAKSPGKMRVSYHLGRLYGDAGDMDRAFSLMQRAGAQAPGFIAGVARNAEAFRQEGGLRAALLRHHDRIRQSPNDPVVRNDLGATLHSYGMAVEAYLEFSEAIRLDPGYAMAYANRGVVLLQQNALDEALRDFRKAVELEPGRPSFHVKLGIACPRAGHTQEAVAQFDAALRLEPGNKPKRCGSASAHSAAAVRGNPPAAP